MDTSTKNYYEVLEVQTNASSEDIYKGYVQAKNAYSQDSIALYSLMTKDECDAIIDLIEEAYTILSDPNKRKQYDSARGFNASGAVAAGFTSPRVTDVFSSAVTGRSEHTLNQKTDSTGKSSMTKIVAKERFNLNYSQNNEFEKEIEQATEYTGDFLKKIREYKNVDISRMADMTKVSKTYIRNIEEEDLTNLPALVYVRGFVYQYAKCLKLNPDLVATSYLYRLKKLKGEA